MSATLLSGPAAEPVSLAEVKQRLRLTNDDEDAVLTALIEAARTHIEDATGLILIEQKWRVSLDEWPERGIVFLPFWPLLSVEKVTLYDDTDQSRILLPSLYHVRKHSRPAKLHLQRSPLASVGAINRIEIDVAAGYGSAPKDVPSPLRQALFMIIDYWFEVRGVAGNTAEFGIPLSALEVMQPYYGRRL